MMTTRLHVGLLAALAAMTPALARAGDELPRRGLLGVMLSPVNDQQKEQLGLESTKGTLITNVVPNSAAMEAGLKANDVIVKVGDKDIEDLPSCMRAFRSYYAGDKVKLTVIRDKGKVEAEVVPRPRPKETPEAYDVVYDFAKTPEGRVRLIISKPKGDGKHPAVVFVQGASPFPVDFTIVPTHPFKTMVESWTGAGLVTVRLERLGTGDSEGPDPQTVRMKQDLASYAETVKKLKTLPYVDGDNVFLFAHSRGAALAPAVAQAEKVKGIVTYAALSRPFMEYYMEAAQRRWKLEMMPEDEMKANEEKMARFAKACYVEKGKPSDILAKDPDLAKFMEDSIQGDNVEGMHYEAWQELAALDLGAAWKKVNVPVLALWGESDYMTARTDSELVAKLVADGKGSFQVVPETDHQGNKAADQEESFLAGIGGSPNPKLAETIQKWIKERATSTP